MALIEPFHIPEESIWNTVGLGRFQFPGILFASILVFLLLGEEAVQRPEYHHIPGTRNTMQATPESGKPRRGPCQ